MDVVIVNQWVAYKPPNNKSGIWRYRVQGVRLMPDVIFQVYQQNGLMYAVRHNNKFYPIGPAVSPYRFDVVAYRKNDILSLRQVDGIIGTYLRYSLKMFQQDLIKSQLLDSIPNILTGTDLLTILSQRVKKMGIPFETLAQVINLQADASKPEMTADMIHYDELGPHIYKFKVRLDPNLRMTLLLRFCTNLDHFPDFATFLAATWVMYQEHQKEFDALRKAATVVPQFG